MPLAYAVEHELEDIERFVDKFDRNLAVSPMSSAVRGGLAKMAGDASRFAGRITHIDTATLYRSYGVRLGQGTSGSFAQVYILPGVTNPRGQRPVVYGPFEFGRGGSHDAFGRTVDAVEPIVLEGAEKILTGAAKAAGG